MNLTVRRRLSRGAWAFALSISLVVSGCSPGGFFGSDRESKPTLPATRLHSQECQGLDLSHKEIPPQSLRKLIYCLDGNGSLGPLRRWVERLSDDDISYFTTWFNQSFLADPTQVHLLEGSIDRLSELKLFRTALVELGRVLENRDFWVLTIQILAQAGQSEHWPKFVDSVLDRGSEQRMEDLLETGAAVFAHPALQSLKEKIAHHPAKADWGSALGNLIRTASSESVADELMQTLKSGDWEQWADYYFGKDSGSVQKRIPEASAVLDYFTSEPSRIEKLGLLLASMKEPVSCLQGSLVKPSHLKLMLAQLSEKVPSADAARILGEEFPLFLVTARSFCNFSQECGDLYPLVFDFIDEGLAPGVISFIQALSKVKRDEKQPAWDLFVHLLSGKGNSRDTSFLKALSPMLQDAALRDFSKDVLLIVSSLNGQSTRRLGGLASLFLDVAPGSSPDTPKVSAFLKALAPVPDELWQKWITAAGAWVHDSDSDWTPMLAVAREGWLSTREHPIFNWLRTFATTIGKDPAYFKSLARTSAYPEFGEAILHVSKMAQNGTFEEIFRDLLNLFRQYGKNQGTVSVTPTQVPVFNPDWRHELDSSQLKGDKPTKPAPPNETQRACRSLDLKMGLDQVTNPNFGLQLDRMRLCEKSSPGQSAFGGLAWNWSKLPLSSGGTLFEFFILRNRQLLSALPQSSVVTLLNKVVDAGKTGSLWRLMDGAAMLSVPQSGSKSWVTELFRALQPLSNEKQASLDLGQGVGQVLDHPKLQEGLKTLRHAMADENTPSRNTQIPNRIKPSGLELARLARWVGNYECERFNSNPSRNWQLERIKEIPNEYEDSITNWDLVKGKPRTSWTLPEFKGWADLLVHKLSYAEESHRSKSMLQSLLRVVSYFDLPAGATPDSDRHYPREYFTKWFHDRSNDYRPIAYYYPDETQPRVRYVNTLDRLELVLLNADVTYILPYNLGLHFLAMIAEAWGDEPREVWPEEIRNRFPPGKRPLTLKQVYAEILKSHSQLFNLIGYPERPNCHQTSDPNEPLDGILDPNWNAGPLEWAVPLRVKAAIFNLKQVVGVMAENLPGSGTPHAGGMTVLRDLFWELYSSTPMKFRTPSSKEKNNLSVIIRFVRLGLARQISRGLREFQASDLTLRDLTDGLIELSSGPGLNSLLAEVFPRSKESPLFWSLLAEIFEILDSNQAPEFKQLMFYTSSLQGRWPKNESGDFWKAQAMDLLSHAVREHREYLSGRPDWISEGLSSKKASIALRSIYENAKESEIEAMSLLLQGFLGSPSRLSSLLQWIKAVDQNPAAKSAAKELDRIGNQIFDSPGFKALRIGDIVDSGLDELETPEGKLLLKFGSQKLRQGDLSIWLDAVSKNPDAMALVAADLGKAIQEGKARPFINRLLESISD